LYEYEACNYQKDNLRFLNRAPINFWEPEKWKKIPRPKFFYEESICHELKYDPTDKKSDTYKKYMQPFSHGTPEQWLEFMEALNIVICGN
jgi:hypothetical protein